LIARRPDWQSRFHRFLEASLSKSFAYGTNDCCLWVADAVLELTGTDIAVAFRGRYSSRSEAASIVKDFAGRFSLSALMERVGAQYGLAPVSAKFAQRGDIVLVRRSRGNSLGLLALDGRTVLAAARTGFLRLPLTRAEMAWRF
jgi:hypothetical protein